MQKPSTAAAALLRALFFVWATLACTAFGADPQTLLLWPDGAPGAIGQEDADKPALILYPAPAEKSSGAAIVVCPGGGYGALAIDHEGHQVARWLNSLGVSAFILKYRLAPRYRHPAPLQDAQRAIRTVRARAAEWKLDPARLGILGFSAGGHLASSAATHVEDGKADAADPIERLGSRPDFQILGYPVISFSADCVHKGSRANLLGPEPPAELVKLFSNELQVSAKTPPAFLVHTSEDRAVPPQNSLLYYEACQKAGVPVEMHIFEKGRHGLGLGGGDPAFAEWPQLCARWLTARGILAPAAAGR